MEQMNLFTLTEEEHLTFSCRCPVNRAVVTVLSEVAEPGLQLRLWAPFHANYKHKLNANTCLKSARRINTGLNFLEFRKLIYDI
jgi:hypothetical protein